MCIFKVKDPSEEVEGTGDERSDEEVDEETNEDVFGNEHLAVICPGKPQFLQVSIR